MNPARVLVNPNAAGGRGSRIVPELERGLGARAVAYDLVRTERPGHARDLARAAAAEGVERLLVVGGDGTIHEAASGILDFAEETGAKGPAVALLPMGTGNDFHRMVRAGKGVEQAVAALSEGAPRPFEVGVVRWEGGRGYCVNLVGVGVDVEVLRRREAFGRLSGLLQYLAAFASAVRRYRPISLAVTLEGDEEPPRSIERRVLLSAVTVGPSVGGGFLLSPRAVPDDGRLDLFLVEDLGLLRTLRYLPGVLRGSTAERKGIWQLQGRRIVMEARGEHGFAFELDGELVETSTPFLEVSVLPDALLVLEPPARDPR